MRNPVSMKNAKGRVVLIIQARMGSTRLPGKSMMDLAGAPLVGRILERVKRCTSLDEIVLAIPDTQTDRVLANLGAKYGVRVVPGSETDLVARYLHAARETYADYIVRLPADNGTPEPSEIDRIVRHHLSLGRRGFSSNLSVIDNSEYPDGIGAEIFDRSLLEEANEHHHDPQQREHVHLNFFNYTTATPVNSDWCPISTVKCPEEFRRPDLILDVNTQAQYEYMRQLYEYLYPRNPEFHITDTIRWHDEVYKKNNDQGANSHGKDYHEYVFREGKLVGEFDLMYQNSETVPWHQDEQENWVDIRLTQEMLRDVGPFDEIHDVGCGLGYYLNTLSARVGSHATRCIGYDVSKTACDKARSIFPAFEFLQLDLTTLQNSAKRSEQPSTKRLFVCRGTLWYVFPHLETVINNIRGLMDSKDQLLVVQNFPPLDKPFIGKDVLPDYSSIISHFSSRFFLQRHIWYADNQKASNDNWFIGFFNCEESK